MTSHVLFRNRIDAAMKLAERLGHLRGRGPLILAIPKGSVPMAPVLAAELGGAWDVVLAHKIGAPGHAEFAMGAVGDHYEDFADVSESEVEALIRGGAPIN